MKRSIFYFLFIITGLSSCTKVVDVDLRNAAPQLVIQGNISDAPGPYTVTLNRSVPYSSPNIFPVVSGATVRIEDVTAGVTNILTESTPGTYITSTLQGIQGHTYNLSITAEGKNYTATSTMPSPAPVFDSLTFQHIATFGLLFINSVPNFQDQPGVENYYQFIQNINGKAPKQIFVYDDRLSDGKYMARQLFNDSAYIKVGDTIQLEMQCIDKNVFNYFKELSGVDQNNGQPVAPGNPTSNIAGGALGYFSAHTSQKKKAIAY